MKFTIVFTTLMCVSTSWAVLAKKVEEPKEKREASVSYGVPGLPSHAYQPPASYSQDASAISVGAGYSIGGSKPSYSFGGQGSSGSLHIPSEGLSPNGHATIQLAPITLQPGHGGYSAGDISQIMSQLSHSLGAGGLSLQPSTAIAEFHQGSEGGQGNGHGQEITLPQLSYGAPKYELSQQLSNSPASYSAGTKGLGSYTSTGPVLFSPSDTQSQSHSGPVAAPSLTYGAANAGHSLGDAASYSLGGAGQSLGGGGHSFGGSPHSFGGSSHSLGAAGHSLGSSGHSFGGSGHSFGGSGHSFGGAGHSLGGSGHSLGGASHSLGGAGHSLSGLGFAGPANSFGGSYKQLGSSYAAPGKTYFKPSAFLGASVQGDAGHGVSGLSGSYGAPSFGGFRGGSHSGLSLGSPSHGAGYGNSLSGFSGGSSKFIGPVYQSGKSEGLDTSALSSGHYASPPGTTYGIPGSLYSSNNAHAASSNRPFYVNAKHHRAPTSSFGQGSSPYRSSASSHSSFSGPKYSYSVSSSPYESDAHGSASETSYNTIKYSEELKPQTK